MTDHLWTACEIRPCPIRLARFRPYTRHVERALDAVDAGQIGHQKSYVCTHVFLAQRPVLYVTRPEGDWCFLCGAEDHPDDASAFRVVGLAHVVERDASLLNVLDLQPDQEAGRDGTGAAWIRSSSN